MFRKLIIIVSLIAFASGSVFALQTTGDKRHRAGNTAQPPDPLVSRKSRRRRPHRREHKSTTDALTVKQKSKLNKN